MINFPYIIFSSSPDVKIVSWSTGTDAEIAAMIAAADAGDISLNNYWNVGDKRTVHLSAIEPGGDAMSKGHPEQDVVLVLMDTGTNSNYTDVNGNTVNFIWGQERILDEWDSVNTTATNIGSWNDSAIRADLNTKYYNALPLTFRNCLKRFNVITAQSIFGTTNQFSQDYISLFAEKEILGSMSCSNETEANALKQIEYFKTPENIIKIDVSGDATYWWTRSPARNAYYPESTACFCEINPNGKSYGESANMKRGIAPFGCI